MNSSENGRLGQDTILGSLPGYGYSDGAGQAYNEAAFRHFLAIERRRAQRSMGSSLVILVTLRGGADSGARLSNSTATAIFGGLDESVREVDFIGWFREGRVAAAVLAQSPTTDPDHAGSIVAERVMRSLKDRLPPNSSTNLRVRVVALAGSRGTRRRDQPARAASIR